PHGQRGPARTVLVQRHARGPHGTGAAQGDAHEKGPGETRTCRGERADHGASRVRVDELAVPHPTRGKLARLSSRRQVAHHSRTEGSFVSGKTSPRSRPPDPRAVRTRNRLGGALIALIQEKPFDDVTVQEVLERAGVSRSTFYEHFRDKDDLFLSDAE